MAGPRVGATSAGTHEQRGRSTQQSLPTTPNPVTTAWSFDTAGRLSSVSSTRNGTGLDSHTYTRDAVGNITQEVITGSSNSTSTFGYDDLYRLTSATVAGTAYSWAYDQVGNRTSQTVGGVNTTYTVDGADHLTAVNGAAVTSDANGNVTQDETGGTYTWDVRGRLVGLNKGGSTYAFQYGPDGLRLTKTVNGTLTTYLLDGSQVVTDTIGGTAYQNLFGPGTDHPLARNGEFFLPNSLGSTTLLTDSGGNSKQGYQYSPFGTLLNSPTDNNPFQFTGRENDGDGLLYYRARYYNPNWGRFVSADPAGSGINPYVYAGDNPVSRADPSGLIFSEGGPSGDPDDLEWRLEHGGGGGLGVGGGGAAVGGDAAGAPGAGAGGARFTGPSAAGPEPAATPAPTYTTLPVPATPQKTVVIGENMGDRVIPYAETNGYSYYRPWATDDMDLLLARDGDWMDDQISAGVRIIDIGPDLRRGEVSRFYSMEVNRVVDRGYPFEYDPQPPSASVDPTSTGFPMDNPTGDPANNFVDPYPTQ